MAEPAPAGGGQARGRGPAPVTGGPHFPGDPGRQAPADGHAHPWVDPGELVGVTLGPGRETARNGLPDSAVGPGREAAVAAGLYAGGPDADGWFPLGRSRPDLRPEIPAGEVDSWSLPDPAEIARALLRHPEAEAG